MISVSYDGYDFSSGGSVVTDLPDYYNPPARDLQTATVAQKDGSVFIRERFQNRTITVEGYIRRSTNALTAQAIKTLKRAVNKREKTLKVVDDDQTLEYTASYQNMIVSRPKGLNYVEFSVSFLCSNPFGYETATTTLLNSSTTQSSESFAITTNGTHEAEPTIIVTFTSVTGGTNKTVTIQNETTLVGISVTSNFATNDVLEIDVESQDVTLNAQTVDFSGRFPTFAPGPGSLSYSDDFTNRDVDIIATYTARNI